MHRAPPPHSRFGERRSRCGCRFAPRWPERRPQSRESRRSETGASRFARCRSITPIIARRKIARNTNADNRSLRSSGSLTHLSASPVMPLEMQTPLSALSGVGPKRAAVLADRGIATVADLLFNLPLHYQDWRARTPLTELEPATSSVVEGRLVGFKERPMRGMRWRRMATGWLEGPGGARVRVVWFNLPAYMKGRMPDGARVVMHGRVGAAPDGGLEIVHPEVYPLDSGAPPSVRAVYGLPSEIGQRVYAGLVAQALAALGGRIDGAMPSVLREQAGVMPLSEALRILHQPPADAEPAKLEAGDSAAQFALAFDEMFGFQLAMGIDRMRAARRTGARMDAPANLTARLLERLPFTPTRAQIRAIDEIGAGLAQAHPMNRLLMGDVGRGQW